MTVDTTQLVRFCIVFCIFNYKNSDTDGKIRFHLLQTSVYSSSSQHLCQFWYTHSYSQWYRTTTLVYALRCTKHAAPRHWRRMALATLNRNKQQPHIHNIPRQASWEDMQQSIKEEPWFWTLWTRMQKPHIHNFARRRVLFTYAAVRQWGSTVLDAFNALHRLRAYRVRHSEQENSIQTMRTNCIK